MHDLTLMSVTLVPAISQDGGALPSNIPGLDSGGADAGTTGADGTGGGGAPNASPFGNSLFMLFALLLVFMIISTMMSARKAKRQAAEMLSALKRGDRVLTSSGMMGTIHDVRDDSIVLRIDDVSGTKAHFAKHAIQQVLKPAKGNAKQDEAAADDNAVAQAG